MLNTPQPLERPVYAAMPAGCYWQPRNFNSLDDQGDLREIIRRISRRYNGWNDRLALHERALEVLQ